MTFPEATSYTVDGVAEQASEGERVTLPAGTVELPPGAVVPVADGIDAQTGEQWARPVDSSGGDSSPVFVYSLLLATFLGTMGLPHILVRFYTNPDGPAARRTTVRVLGLLAAFYAFPVVYGALGRVLVPELYMTGETDSVVLALPEAAWPGLGGEILGALVAAGAFAAFMSTASGLMVSVAGTISFDLWRRGGTDVAVRRRRFRVAALAGVLAPVALALVARGLDISVLVGWAFALAASTFCPLLLLGIWWEGLTARGAALGLVAGAIDGDRADLRRADRRGRAPDRRGAAHPAGRDLGAGGVRGHGARLAARPGPPPGAGPRAAGAPRARGPRHRGCVARIARA